MRLLTLLLATFLITILAEFAIVRAVTLYSRGKHHVRPDGIPSFLGLAVLAISLRHHLPDAVAISLVTVTALLWALARVDIHTGYLPDPLIATLLFWTILHRAFILPAPLLTLILGLVPATLLLIVHALKPEGLGLGDVKLTAALGLLLGGRDAFYGILLGMLIAAGWALIAVRRGKLTWTQSFPYGPFLILGAWLMLIFRLWL